MKITIGETKYELHSLTRGDVRQITGLEGEEQLDEMVRRSLQQDDVDDIPMADFMRIVEEATSYNGLDSNAIIDAKKN